jgi:hypothetical protein
LGDHRLLIDRRHDLRQPKPHNPVFCGLKRWPIEPRPSVSWAATSAERAPGARAERCR